MLSVIGSLIGFASSTAPALADHFKQKSNQKFELEKYIKNFQKFLKIWETYFFHLNNKSVIYF